MQAESTEQSPTKLMESFIDKLCDHLTAEKIKILIDSGFDQWETITFIQGQQLVQLGYTSQECISILLSVNATAREHGHQEIFADKQIQLTMGLAKQRQDLQKQNIMKQVNQKQSKSQKIVESSKTLPSSKSIKQYPMKQINEALILKGTTMKPKAGQKISLNKITMVSLQQKQLTHMQQISKAPNIANLHLGSNHIYKIEGLEGLNKIKVLKLQHNQICNIQGLQNLVALQRLFLANNFIDRLENLTKQPNLQLISISRQKIDNYFTFDPQTMYSLAYTLQKLQCDQCRVKNITDLKYLSVIRDITLAKNLLQDIGELSEVLANMQRLKTLSFKDNPLAKTQKYRDYIVILSKSLQQLDGKKILPKQREYLVKLYALKHAKSQQQEPKPNKTDKADQKMKLNGVKVQEQSSYHNMNMNINKATDLRGNVPYSNTKYTRK